MTGVARITTSIMALLLIYHASGCASLMNGRTSDEFDDIFADYEVVANAESFVVGFRINDVHPKKMGKRQAIPLNEPFDIVVVIGDRMTRKKVSNIELAVDAAMPEHMHGMNVQPKITRDITYQFGVRFVASGMLFHMPGRWELYFDITRDGVTERAQTEIVLE